jgi:hypothetical protein
LRLHKFDIGNNHCGLLRSETGDTNDTNGTNGTGRYEDPSKNKNKAKIEIEISI